MMVRNENWESKTKFERVQIELSKITKLKNNSISNSKSDFLIPKINKIKS